MREGASSPPHTPPYVLHAPCPASFVSSIYVGRGERSHPQDRQGAVCRQEQCRAPIVPFCKNKNEHRTQTSSLSLPLATADVHTYLVWGRHVAALWGFHSPVFADVCVFSHNTSFFLFSLPLVSFPFWADKRPDGERSSVRELRLKSKSVLACLPCPCPPPPSLAVSILVGRSALPGKSPP